MIEKSTCLPASDKYNTGCLSKAVREHVGCAVCTFFIWRAYAGGLQE
jgi:hypothetical protein